MFFSALSSLCLNDFESLVLQLRIGPHQATKIARRHIEIGGRVGDVAGIAAENLDDHIVVEIGDSGGNVGLVSYVFQHLIVLIKRKLSRDDETAAKFRFDISAAREHQFALDPQGDRVS